jgi:hypothetical protein
MSKQQQRRECGERLDQSLAWFRALPEAAEMDMNTIAEITARASELEEMASALWYAKMVKRPVEGAA